MTTKTNSLNVKSLEDLGLDNWYHVGLLVSRRFIRVSNFKRISLNDLDNMLKDEIKEIEKDAKCKLFINRFYIKDMIIKHLSKLNIKVN